MQQQTNNHKKKKPGMSHLKIQMYVFYKYNIYTLYAFGLMAVAKKIII